MADSIYTFAPVAADNSSLDSIPYGANQLYHNKIDDLFRAFGAKLAQFADDLGAVNTVGGTADAITVTLASGITAYATGQLFRFTAAADNTGATTMNVNAIGAKAVRKISSGADVALVDGDILDGKTYLVIYDAAANSAAGAFILDTGGGQSIAGRNLLINGLGTINQRGYVSGAATSGANQYTLDRWRVVTSGQALSWSESEGVRTMTAPADGVEQIIEGAGIVSGSHVLNWEGTATATVGGSARTKGEVFTLTGGSNVTVKFIDGTFSKPQLEAGIAPTPFEVRASAQEWALCRWFYERIAVPSGRVVAVGQVFSSTALSWQFRFNPKRTTSYSVSVATTIRPLIADGGYSTGTPSHSVTSIDTSSISVGTTVTSGLVAGNASILYSESASTITIDAELT